MELRDFIKHARTNGYLVEVNGPTSPHLEMARIAHRDDGRPVLFTTVEGYPGWQVIAGIASARRYFADALGVAIAQVAHVLAEALAHPKTCPIVKSAPCQEVVEPEVDLERLPILRYFPFDGGRYITSGILILSDPDYGPNVAFHRLMQLDSRRFATRVVEGRGTDTAWRKTEADIPVAICIGNALHVLLAAAMSAPPSVSELEVANALVETPLVACRTVPLYVPAQCEVVLEGRLTHTMAPEGPFVDLTETLDFVRLGPVVEIDCITRRHNPIFHALLPGGLEHKHLMGIPKEPTILAAVNRVCRCTNVVVTPGGTSWLHAVVQIDKQAADDGCKAIYAAFEGHGSLKHVVVVDTDIDPFDMNQVEWAIATRFQADRDLVILTDQPGSSLDPSAIHRVGQKTRTAKMGLDATIPWGADRTAFQKVHYEADSI
ncbi:MAG: UbiD family decarboxylase [Anaerolineae bacterium]